MVQIRRMSGGYTQKGNKGAVTHFPGNEVIYEDNAASFRGLILRELLLKYANLDAYDLREADFSHAQLDGSSMRNAQLAGARFVHADMPGCNLNGAVIGDADFAGANLLFADFSDCDMRKACFDGAHLDMCFYTVDTIWPAGVDPEAVHARRWDLWDVEEYKSAWDSLLDDH